MWPNNFPGLGKNMYNIKYLDIYTAVPQQKDLSDIALTKYEFK